MSTLLFVPLASAGTFYDGSQSAELDVEIPIGGEYLWNTGIFIYDGALPANATFLIHVETRCMRQDNGDNGSRRYLVVWDTPPVPSASPGTSLAKPAPGLILTTDAAYATGNYGELVGSSPNGDISLATDNELVLNLDNDKGVAMQATLKVTVAPVKTLPFDPRA
jgi:hypothetical protein